MKVAAVVHEPFGAFPSPLQGFYARDHEFFHRYHEESRTVEGTRAWLERWVLGVEDWRDFRDRLGEARLEAVRVKTARPALPADFGA